MRPPAVMRFSGHSQLTTSRIEGVPGGGLPDRDADVLLRAESGADMCVKIYSSAFGVFGIGDIEAQTMDRVQKKERERESEGES